MRLQTVQYTLAWAALVLLAVLAWWFLMVSAATMASMRGAGPLLTMAEIMMTPGRALPYLATAAAMWVTMMIAMMTPAVLPMLQVFRGLERVPTSPLNALCFAAGYLACWSAFALVASVVQWWLHGHGLLGGAVLATSRTAAAAILLAAGLWQLTPLKSACLAHCRGPLGFFMAHWRAGPGGAFVMGLQHGLFCLGCCWLLMVLMFAGGAMSVPTMAAISALILAERVLPAGPWVARIPALALIVLGCALAAVAG